MQAIRASYLVFFNPESPTVIPQCYQHLTQSSQRDKQHNMLIEIHNIPPGGLECDIEISIDVADEGIYMQNGYMEKYFFPQMILFLCLQH